MARAGKVKGIKPRKSLRSNAERVIALRLEELLSWRRALHDPALVTELHDMRIAAKRLRYALEMFDVCYPQVKGSLKVLTDMQEDLGALHDLDVLAEVLHGRLAPLDAAIQERAAEIMGGSGTQQERNMEVRRLLAAAARDPRRIGLVSLIGDKVTERRRRYADFSERWTDSALDAFATEVRIVTGLRPPPDADGGEVAMAASDSLQAAVPVEAAP